jgi:hypothetical protein
MLKPDESMSMKKVAHHAYRLFKSATADSRPRITLSKNLYFRVFPDKAVLVSLGADDSINISLSLDALRTILGSIHLASSSGQIRTIKAEGLTVETDGRPQVRALVFDESPLSWLWKPALVASAVEPSIDYIRIDIRGPLLEHIRGVIQKSRLELAYAELANLEGRK